MNKIFYIWLVILAAIIVLLEIRFYNANKIFKKDHLIFGDVDLDLQDFLEDVAEFQRDSSFRDLKKIYKTVNKTLLRCEVILRSSLFLQSNHSCAHKSVLNVEKIDSDIKILPLLITGTGRSGTTFLTALLNELGLKLSHDSYGPDEDGGVSWLQAFNDDRCSTPEYNWRVGMDKRVHKVNYRYRFKNVFHLVREPLKMIESRADAGFFGSPRNANQYYLDCVIDIGIRELREKVQPEELDFDFSLILALRHWVLWNTFLDFVTENFLRLEDVASGGAQSARIVQAFFVLPEFRDKFPNEDKIHRALNFVVDSRNSAHTKKLEEFNLSWNYLSKLDRKFAIMAQILALNYGYDIFSKDLLPDALENTSESGEEFSLKKIDCSFNRRELWSCNI